MIRGDRGFYRKLLIPLGGGLLLFLVGSFLLIPRVRKVKKQFAQNKQLIASKEDFLQKAQLIGSLDEDDLTAKAYLATLAMPKEKEISLVLYALSYPVLSNAFYTEQLEFNLGEITNPEEASPSAKEKKTLGPIDQIPVKMRVLGPGNRLSSLLEEMETILPLIAISEIKVNYNLGNRANVDFAFYLSISGASADYFPEKLTLADLTLSEAEEDLLAQLEGFKKASFASELLWDDLPPEAVGRENPFVLFE